MGLTAVVSTGQTGGAQTVIVQIYFMQVVGTLVAGFRREIHNFVSEVFYTLLFRFSFLSYSTRVFIHGHHGSPVRERGVKKVV